MSEPVYSRAPDVVWRLGPNRVLVRRVNPTLDAVGTDAQPSAEDGIVELHGPVAIVWLALDDPAKRTELERRLSQEGVRVGDLDREVSRLIDVGLIVELAC